MKKLCWNLAYLAVLGSYSVHAQDANQTKPPFYLYLSQWAVPRTEWAEMVKLDEGDKPVLDKLLADGTITGYGASSNMIHQEGEPTHTTWFMATSDGKLMKTLEALYAHPGSTDSKVEADSKHWDFILTGTIYNQKSGKLDGGYLSGDAWQVKPGQMHAFHDYEKRELIPLYEKMLADGIITSYGVGVEDYHTGKIGRVWSWFTVADAASLDRANDALDQAMEKNPSSSAAFRSLVDDDGHRDFLERIRYQNIK